jgi:hypothetical protein
MLDRPDLQAAPLYRGFTQLTVSGGNRRFVIGEVDPHGITRLRYILGGWLRELDLGTFRGQTVTDCLSSWSYWTLYFWPEDDDLTHLGVMVQSKECENVAWALLDRRDRERWLSAVEKGAAREAMDGRFRVPHPR